MSTSYTAEVTMTIKVNSSQSWSGDCALDQIHKQATEDVTQTVHQSLNGNVSVQKCVVEVTKIRA